MLKSCFACDFRDGQICFPEVLLNSRNPEPLDFFVRRTTKDPTEPILEDSAGQGDMVQNVTNLNAVEKVLADESQGGSHVRIINSEYVRGLTRCDSQRCDQVSRWLDWSPGHHAVQQSGRLESGSMGIGDYAGQRRSGQIAQKLVVIDSENCDFIRDLQICFSACSQYVASCVVITGQQTGWSG